MLYRALLILTLFLPMVAHAQQSSDIGKYLLGKWQVESIKERGDKAFHPPHQPVKWQFTRNGELIEELGSNGAKIHWHYHVSGRDIIVQLNNMAFRWRVISMEPRLMLVRHQLGLYKVKRI